ncbi:hypothetical protein GCM10023115_24630 [Pontixanthobacter gangjinensis]|uniref:Lipoprotein n=1 Tax=Christiangramia aestuarii TaxID=1028746 RepID=A0A7K1LT09_9FLAO|nr:DUF6252 family protein [Christiangramia aestuarii]MUP43918.1 hypothetical protein [Christiangramia aestuarii]
MKLRLFYLLVILLTTLTSCSKENESCESPVDCLPPATQTGANTVGCLVDGKVLVPAGKGFGTGAVLKAQYSTYEGDILFGIVVRDVDSGRNLYLELRSERIEEKKNYELNVVSDTTNYAIYSQGSLGFFQTNEIYKGEIYFSKVDFSKRIASGTFWFDAKDDENGEVVEVREGRFDVVFF